MLRCLRRKGLAETLRERALTARGDRWAKTALRAKQPAGDRRAKVGLGRGRRGHRAGRGGGGAGCALGGGLQGRVSDWIGS